MVREAACGVTVVQSPVLACCCVVVSPALSSELPPPQAARARTRISGTRYFTNADASGENPGVDRVPIRYARSGDVSVAYQVTGDGPIDLVLVHGFFSHLEV